MDKISPKDFLCELEALTAHDMAGARRVMSVALRSDVPLIAQLGEHMEGGKFLRPMLLIATTRLCGGDNLHMRFLAAALEMIHNATLLHDDVIDESLHRRGKLTAHHRFSNKASILVGDFFLGRAFHLMERFGTAATLRVLTRSAAMIAEGETLQLMVRGKIDMDEETYWRIITAKTARLFSAAMEMGALLADASAATCQKMRDYGLALGIFYQCVDDILDYAHWHEGKDVGDDLNEGRITLPIILAYRQGSKAERALIEDAFKDKSQRASYFLSLRTLLLEKGYLEQCFAYAWQNYQKALPLMEEAKNDKWGMVLMNVGHFAHQSGRDALTSNKTNVAQGSLAA